MVAAPDEVVALPTPGHSRAVPFPWQTVTPAPDQGTHITELQLKLHHVSEDTLGLPPKASQV